MSAIIGIDLGTSTTEAAIYRDGKPELILNFLQQVVTPSAVGIDDAGNWIAGERARAQYLLSPERTAIEIKRAIGTNRTFLIGKKGYSPAELSAKILEYVRAYAAEYLGETIERAVISVPAYFNDTQRQETLKAGMLSGLRVERIINEPTAAALSYGLDHMEEESHILVYDLGGGTFDVTLLEMFEGVLEVKASSGDNQLGGKDFDERLIKHFCDEFVKQHGIDPQNEITAMARLKNEAENCKKALSESESYRAVLPNLMKKGNAPAGLDITVSREEFEVMTADLLKRSHAPIDSVLYDSGLTKDEINCVILVGGSTRMPMVEKDIEEYLHVPVRKAVDPDFAVAQGAAIQGAIMTGEISPDEGLIMTDVNPYSLGVRTAEGFANDYMSIVIPRNTTIPALREQIYSTCGDYQTEAEIEVYQGESSSVFDNSFLGRFTVGGIPPKKAGKEKIRVGFSYDMNGILSVKATIVSTGEQGSIDIDMNNADVETKPQIDYEKWKEVPGASKYRSVIRKAEKLLDKIDRAQDPEVYDALEMAVRNIKSSIILEDEAFIKECEELLRTTIRIIEKEI
ncbi:MAG: Hsp70 family protein [Blautia sp.]|nr:Hsp70 family protein [Blautia sp.]